MPCHPLLLRSDFKRACWCESCWPLCCWCGFPLTANDVVGNCVHASFSARCLAFPTLSSGNVALWHCSIYPRVAALLPVTCSVFFFMWGCAANLQAAEPLDGHNEACCIYDKRLAQCQHQADPAWTTDGRLPLFQRFVPAIA